jgi:hypothetical protein
MVLAIVDTLGKGQQGNGIQFLNAGNRIDAQLRAMVYLPAMPHVPQVSFRTGVMHLVSRSSRKDKTAGAHSMGKIPSTHFVTLLLLLYCVIGDSGLILPNVPNFWFIRNNGDRFNCKNVTNKVLSAIINVLSLYFECKRATHTDASLTWMEELVRQVFLSYLLVWELVQIMVGDGEGREFKVRKLHFIFHYVAVIRRMGSLRHFDTSHLERIHKTFTTSVWDNTSHRYSKLLYFKLFCLTVTVI